MPILYLSFLLSIDVQAENMVTEDIVPYQDVQVTFYSGGWRFFLGTKGEIGFPSVSFTKFYARKDKKLVKISSPYDFNKLDRIEIKSENEALGFVRIFTGRDIFSVFEIPKAIEVDASNARVTRANNYFIIKRKLVYLDSKNTKGYKLDEVIEKVYFDGKYELESRKSVGIISEKEANIPVFE